MCNEQTGINYQATVENQTKITELEKQLHDREILIDQMHARLERLEARLNLHDERHSLMEGQY